MLHYDATCDYISALYGALSEGKIQYITYVILHTCCIIMQHAITSLPSLVLYLRARTIYHICYVTYMLHYNATCDYISALPGALSEGKYNISHMLYYIYVAL